MKTDKQKTKRRRQSHKPELPTKFEPRFWADCDQRFAPVRAIKERYESLKTDTACDSKQKDLMCQRAAFISIYLETMECDALEGKAFNAGTHFQATNTLTGLLKSLGIDKQAKSVTDIRAYAAGGAKA